jgi:hypothetical protein
MSLLVPQNAFNDFHEARHSWPSRLERDKLTGIAITAAIHLAIVAVALRRWGWPSPM